MARAKKSVPKPTADPKKRVGLQMLRFDRWTGEATWERLDRPARP